MEKQYKNMVIGAVFAAIGAALFTAAAFLGGGVVCALIGVALLATTIGLAVAASNMLKAINGLKESVRTTQDTVDKLNEALPIMKDIKDYLGDITNTWNTIATKLGFISQQYDLWSISFPIFKVAVKVVVQSWKDIQTACEHYLTVVSDT